MEINKNVITTSQVSIPEPQTQEPGEVLTTNKIQPHEFPKGEGQPGSGGPMITTENVEKMKAQAILPAAEAGPVAPPVEAKKPGRPKQVK